MGSLPVQRSGKNLKKGYILGAAGGTVLLAGALVFYQFGGGKASSGTSSSAVVRPVKLSGEGAAESVTVRLRHDRFHPWPPSPEVLGPPASTPDSGEGPARPEPKAPKASLPRRSPGEPTRPTAEELKNESVRTGDELSLDDARSVLLDEKRSSTFKLAIIDKLGTLPPEEVVPVLVAFLNAPGGSGARYTKPTAVKVLRNLRDPLADEALAKLGRTSPDESVRITIMALEAKEKSR